MVSFPLPQSLVGKQVDAFLDHFLENAIDAKGLMFGGGIGKTTEGFVALRKRGDTTGTHRQQLKS